MLNAPPSDVVGDAPQLPAELIELRREAAIEDNKTATLGGSSSSSSAPEGAAVVKTETVEELRAVIDYVVDELLLLEYPHVAPAWTPARRDRLAHATRALFVKRGWSLEMLGMKWKEEIGLLLAIWPIAKETKKLLASPPPAPAPSKPAPQPQADGASLKPNTGT